MQDNLSVNDNNLSLGMDNCHTQAQVRCRQTIGQSDQDKPSGQTETARWDDIAEEVPVALVYNGISHVVMMASPHHLEDFAIGFSLSEGIIAKAADIYAIELVGDSNQLEAGIEVLISISTQSERQLKQRRRNLAGRTGCGLCGAESLQQAIRPVQKVTAQALVSAAAVENAIRQLNQQQQLQPITGAFHAAAWCLLDGSIRLLREDIGRHNALDKLLGALQQQQNDLSQGFVLVSSRASYEMVHKSSSCGVATLVAVSAPTQMALNLAKEAGMNLIGFARSGRHIIYNQTNSL